MPLSPEVAKALSGQTVAVSQFSVVEEIKHPDSILHQTLNIKFKDFHQTQCYICVDANLDFCWNCETPICDKHAYTLVLPTFLALNICGECKTELLKLMVNEKLTN